ncbi:hypothetical protein SEA_PAITO_45 [Mycobacterium phage Paito]|uniref:Uncharacterized protein n=1 Tax=Mycobacterium phage Paito TaxID=2315544 RepID=A0A386KH39_9CAUD|nr:hypothetical protein KDW68_gp45 [Mycobacterium phage Paito]AYD84630.1 hypothetical protein SEA_PAITO_45 [Mycobacterium phage Paito]
MIQSDIDRIARQVALRLALKHAEGYGDADEVVATAETFRAFLAGETPAATTTEGNE